ncbi:MAG: DUF5686 and carboxypeptidase regulatory-like domain-containing protein [Bacteroidales bacterium]|jgi:hypothetical protein|nr:DUF5686 and carboxypeptidase regulatory-like domain-containing protein [Bacteroidales bacterium]
MSRRLKILFILLVFTFSTGFSQDSWSVSGRVIDGKTKEPLPFVNIIINNGNTGGTTDIDGKFHLQSGKKIQTLQLSYVGYETQTYSIGNRTENLLISLTRKEIELQEVEILPGINPAHRIIRNAIENRELNDPEKVETFSYTAYDKTVFTLNSDTTLQGDFSALVDTSMLNNFQGIEVGFSINSDSVRKDSIVKDSTTRLLEKLISKQYLFLMENVTKRKFMAPDKNYNRVVATKMSGFKDPILVFLATQIQSFSFYKPFITIFQKEYVNPIGSGSLNKYFFKLEDTTYVGKDSVFIISFRPRKGTNFDGLKGVIAINSNRWGIQNVSAEPYPNSGGFTVRIHQLYELIGGERWFPVQLNTDVAFNNMRIGKFKPIGSGKSYIRDIILNPEMVRREFNHLDVEVDKDATSRSEPYWNQFRVDSLTLKDRQTYKVLDSVGEANNFDKMARTLQTLLTGRIPWGPIDFDINRFINYNTYEGLVLGAGLHTNDRLVKGLKIGGFYQYAFAISTAKYGGDVSYLVNRRHDVTLSGSYYFDLIESGGTSFPADYESVLSGNFRQLLLKKLDLCESFNFSLGFRALKYVLFNVGISNDFKKSATYDLAIPEGNTVILKDQFRFTTITAGFKWAYGEKFIQTVNNKISLGTKYPVVWLQYTRGIKNFLDGEYDYDRFDLKIRKTFTLKYLGKLTLQLNGGYIDQPIPVCNLFYAPGSYRLITLYAPNSFATMRSNEFLSNKFTSVYIYHDFGYLLFKGKKWFHPEFALSQNIGFGWLDNKERYAYNTVDPKEMNLGYYESGLLINNLINLRIYTVGIGAFYRWGPYSMDNTGDNFAYKISMIFLF